MMNYVPDKIKIDTLVLEIEWIKQYLMRPFCLADYRVLDLNDIGSYSTILVST